MVFIVVYKMPLDTLIKSDGCIFSMIMISIKKSSTVGTAIRVIHSEDSIEIFGKFANLKIFKLV